MAQATVVGIPIFGRAASLRKIDVRIRVWLCRGERHLGANVQPRPFIKWQRNGFGRHLCRRQNQTVIIPGILKSRRYIDEILRPHVVLHLRQMGRLAVFQHDNRRPHLSRIRHVLNF